MTIPVVLLTGFLGAGKTTLLNDLLKRREFRETAVIINEAGDVGIDHLLIEKGSDDVVLLEGGCVCCRMRGGLGPALQGLLRRRAVDGLAFKRVIVETSGLADPSVVLHGMIADPRFSRHFSLGGVTAVMDAVHLPATLAHHPEATIQVAVADRLLITKADLVSGAALAEIEAQLVAINPRAERRVVEPRTRDGRLIWIDPAEDHDTAFHHTPFMASGVSHEVSAAGRTFAGEFSRDAVDDWLDYTNDLFGASLLRLKGVLRIEGVSSPVILHGVQGLVYSPGTLTGPQAMAGDSRMMLIGRGIGAPDLDDALVRLEQAAHLAA
jgi:G3E family GTPase